MNATIIFGYDVIDNTHNDYDSVEHAIRRMKYLELLDDALIFCATKYRHLGANVTLRLAPERSTPDLHIHYIMDNNAFFEMPAISAAQVSISIPKLQDTWVKYGFGNASHLSFDSFIIIEVAKQMFGAVSEILDKRTEGDSNV